MIISYSDQAPYRAPLTEADYYFFPKIQESGDELPRMCFWEYARECRPLIKAVAALKEAVSQSLNLSDPDEIATETYNRVKRATPITDTQRSIAEQDEFFEKWINAFDRIETIAGRFDWSRLCSRYFPTSPWIENKECRIKEGEEIFRSSRLMGLENPEVVRADHMAHLHRPIHLEFSGDSESELRLEIEQRDLVEELSQLASRRPCTLHLLVLKDEYFDLYDPEVIASEFRKFCRMRNRKRLIPAQDQESPWRVFQQSSAKEMLLSLAIARIYTHLSSDELTRIRRKTRLALQASDESKRLLAEMAYSYLKRGCRLDIHLKACGRVYRQMFNIPKDDFPISVLPKYMTPSKPRKKRGALKVTSHANPLLSMERQKAKAPLEKL